MVKELLVSLVLDYWQVFVTSTVLAVIRGFEKCKMRSKYEALIKRIIDDLTSKD